MSVASIDEIQNYSPDSWYYSVGDKLLGHTERRLRKCFENAKKRREEITDTAGLEKYQQKMRESFINNLGGIPYDKTLPLNPQITGVIEEENLVIEKIIFESRPKVYVTANLYLPKNRKEKCGAVLFQIGHAAAGKASDRYQKVARLMASAGLIVFVIEPVGQGERLSYYEPELDTFLITPTVGDHQYAGNQCVLMGDNIARYFIADAMRAVDYLETRPEVDSSKIGATGSSGGGTATCHLMICDKRIKAAAPGTFVSTMSAILSTAACQDAEQIWYNSAKDGFDHHEALICFAPKPTLLLTVDSDFFPIEGALEVMEKTKRFWKMYEKETNLQMVTDRSHHCYTDVLAFAAAEFFAYELNGEQRCANEKAIKSLPKEMLFATSTGQVCSSFEDAKFVFNENLEKFIEKKGTNIAEFAEFIKEKMNYDREPAPLCPRRFGPMFDHGGMYENGLKAEPYLWFAQRDLPNFGLLFTDNKAEVEKCVICLWANGTNAIETHIYKIRKMCREGCAVLVLDLSGMGKLMPNKPLSSYNEKKWYGVLDFISKGLFALGDSLCALRLFELSYAERFVKKEVCKSIEIYAEGSLSNLVRLYGAAFPEIKTETEEAVESLEEIINSIYYEDYDIAGVLLPGVGKYF